jgi:hypothetical protein
MKPIVMFLFAATALAQTSCPVKLEVGFWRNCKNTSSKCLNCDTNCINFKLTNLMADKIVHLEIMAKFDETKLNPGEKGRTDIYVSDDSTAPGQRRDYLWEPRLCQHQSEIYCLDSQADV